MEHRQPEKQERNQEIAPYISALDILGVQRRPKWLFVVRLGPFLTSLFSIPPETLYIM